MNSQYLVSREVVVDVEWALRIPSPWEPGIHVSFHSSLG